jgi:uncharacterized repeat protein (TIGR01451 family)
MKRSRRASACALTALLAVVCSLLFALAAPPAAANQVFATDCGGNDWVEEFHRNQSVCVTGDVDTIRPKEILPSADIYVVRNDVWNGGEGLSDVSGGKNRVVGTGLGGAFYDQPVWLAPLTPGYYDLVVDEGQNPNGVYDAGIDYVLGEGPEPAFRVLGADLAGYTFDVSGIKAHAFQERERYRKIAEAYRWAQRVSSAGTGYGWGSAVRTAGAGGWTSFGVGLGAGLIDFYRFPLDYNSHVITMGADYVKAVSSVQYEHWNDLYNDPADPNYWMPVGIDLDGVRTSLTAQGVDPRYPAPVEGGDPLVARYATLSDRMSEQAALVHAVMHAHEKYLGARDADDLAWAVAHAEEVARYSGLLERNMTETKAALAAARAELATYPGAADPLDVQGYAAIQSRLATSGFTAAEREQASELGFDDEALERLRAELLALELPGSTASPVQLLDDAIATTTAGLPVVREFGEGAAAVAEQLTTEVEPVARPVADAGGPYAATPGTPVVLDASGSTGATAYAWDTDLDGEFDDATGATATVTPSRTGRLLVGLRASAADGAADTAYAEVEAAGGNAAPRVSATDPASSPVTVAPGTTKRFAVTASDPDGDDVSVAWTVDGVAAGTGAAFDYKPGTADLGAHVVAATVSDDDAVSGDSGALWHVAVVPPDADGDGWRAHVDCDDANPDVSPGETEIIGNGIDDDCRAATSDDGEPPAAAFTAPARAVNVAHTSAGATATASTVRNTTTSYRADNVLDDSLGTLWASALGQTRNQSIRIKLGDGPDVVERIALRGSTGTTTAKNVEVRTSLDGTTFTSVLTTALPRNETGIDTAIAPVRARWVELLLKDNHGDASYLSLHDARIFTRGRTGGFVSLAEGPAARAIAATTEASGSPASAALVETGQWRTTSRTNQSLTVELAGAKSYPVDRVRLRSSSTGEAAKNFTVAVSDSADPASFRTVLTAVGAASTATQVFAFPATTARYARLTVVDNNSTGCCIRVDRFELLTPDGVNAASGDGVGAVALSATSGATTARNAIDYDDTTYWESGSGTTTNQELIVRLLDGGPHEIDRVRVNSISGSRSARSIAVAVSSTGLAASDFTTVRETVLPSDGLDHWLVFPARQARYVKLVVKDAHGGSTFRVRSVQVFSPRIGGPEAKFDNASTDPEGRPLASSWDFGDGGTSTETHPAHTYAAPGAYDVALTVRDTEGLTDTTTAPYRNVAPPVADLGLPAGPLGEGSSLAFTDRSSDAAVGVVAWEWDFGFSKSTLRHPSVAYADNGTYDVTLTATNGQEVRSSATRSLTVVNLPPTLSLGSTASLFTLQSWTPSPSVSDPGTADRASLVCDWDYGDGETKRVSPCTSSTAATPHAYDLPGRYTARLKVTDKDGASIERTVAVDVKKRDTVLSNVRTSYVAGGVSVAMKLYERNDLKPVAGATLRVALLGRTEDVVTAADGTASVVLPVVAAATDVVSMTFAGDARHNGTSATRAVRAPLGDVVFAVDESGSMGGAQAGVQNSITDVALRLGASVDFRLGLVGFGASRLGGAPFSRSPLTDDLGQYLAAVRQLEVSGGFEPGFAATEYAMSAAMQPRADAGTCVVLVTDEDADIGAAAPTTKAQALAALRARNAVFFAIVNSDTQSRNDYGPNPGSLAAETGGLTFSIGAFTSNPTPVIDAIVAKCVDQIQTADLAVTKTDGVTEVEKDDEVDYTLTVTNAVDQPATGVLLTDTLPAGTTFVSADGALLDGNVVRWPAFDLPARGSTTRTVRVRIGGGFAAGALVTNRAAVADDGSRGPDLTPADNTATDTDSYVVRNVPPTVDAGTDTAIDEGSSFALAGAYADADAGDTHTVSVDWGDGTTTPYVPSAAGVVDPAHAYPQQGTYEVKVTVTDSVGHVATDSVVVTVRNVAPVVSLPASVEVDEGGNVTLAGSFTDPGADTWTAASGDQPVALDGKAFTVERSYTDDGTDSVTVCVRDDAGAEGCATTAVVVRNTAPAVTATGSTAPEGASAGVTAAYRDLGVTDTHTAEVEWGDGSPVETVAVTPTGDGHGTVSAAHAYGDEGVYTVRVTVADEDGAAGSATTSITVSNVGPAVTIAAAGTRTFAGGLAVVAGAGAPVTFTAEGTDPGADRLTFTWATGGSASYPSGGAFPVSATDATTASFPAGYGVQTVTLTDNDGGSASASLPVLVTGTSDCTFTQGYWRHQYATGGSPQVPRATSAAYLTLVSYASRVFSELTPAGTPAEARVVFEGRSTTMRRHATEQLLAAWLNFAHGGVGLDEKVDTDRDGTPDLTFAEIVQRAEDTLLDPTASQARLEVAKSLAEAVNLHAHHC